MIGQTVNNNIEIVSGPARAETTSESTIVVAGPRAKNNLRSETPPPTYDEVQKEIRIQSDRDLGLDLIY